MTNPFSTDSLIPNWAEASTILKGDFDGHPFRGNQYSQAVADAESHMDAAKALVEKGDGHWESVVDQQGAMEEPDGSIYAPFGDTWVNAGTSSANDIASLNRDATKARDAYESAYDHYGKAAAIHEELAKTVPSDAHANVARALRASQDKVGDKIDMADSAIMADPSDNY